MNEKRDFKGIWIPAEIWKYTEISPIEVMIWGAINHFDKGHGCKKSNRELAEIVGRCEGALKVHLRNMRKMGLVENLGFDGRIRTIQALYPSIVHDSPSIENNPAV